MTDLLVFLTSITIILLTGIIAISLSKRTKISLPLLLFFAGLIVGNILYLGKPIVQLTGAFLSTFSIVSLIIVLFYSFSNLKIHDFDKSMKEGLQFFVLLLLANTLIMSYLVKFLFSLQWFAAIIFSFLISCIEYHAVFSRSHVAHHKVLQILKSESHISSSFVLLVPFVIIAFMQSLSPTVRTSFLSNALPILVDIFAGIGAGIVISLILFKVINSKYLEKSVSFVMAVALLIAFVVAQKLGGNGLIAIATIGFIFGNIFLKQKEKILMHSNVIYSIFEIFVFILAGIVVGLPYSLDFYRISLGLFIVYLLIRFILANLALRHFDFLERAEIAFFVPKGLATVTVAFALLNYSFLGSVLLVQLLLAFFVYSLIFDTILDKIGFYDHR